MLSEKAKEWIHPLQMLFPQHGKYVSALKFVKSSSCASAKLLIGTDDIVAGGSEIQHINLNGIGIKQMGQSSFGGGSLNRISSRSSAARSLHAILCFNQ
jgi:hypothetical protein